MESEAPDKKVGIFSKIKSRDDAQKTIKEWAFGFFGLAAIQGGIGYFIAPLLILDAVAIAVLAGIMFKWNSRIAAVLLLLLACASGYSTVLSRLGMAEGGRNLILAVIFLWGAIRSVEATFKVNGKYARKDS